MNKHLVVGLGHKARAGKDSAAGFIKESFDNVVILHFADDLYEEVSNKNRKAPLIQRSKSQSEYIYSLLHSEHLGNDFVYSIRLQSEVPILHDIFTQRGINEYWGMDEKDAPMLQFWGTEYRRKQIDNYWVQKVHDKLETLFSSDQQYIIVIADTRFPNEVEFIQSLGSLYNCNGVYVKIERLNEDGSVFIDPSRNHGHPSEVSLNNTPAFKILRAKTGDLESLKIQAQKLIHSLLEN